MQARSRGSSNAGQRHSPPRCVIRRGAMSRTDVSTVPSRGMGVGVGQGGRRACNQTKDLSGLSAHGPPSTAPRPRHPSYYAPRVGIRLCCHTLFVEPLRAR
jgi:hypothetical protein